MPHHIICDCPYMYGGGECVNQGFGSHEASDCTNCPVYLHWYHK